MEIIILQILTNVGDFISHHVFIVVDSGIWNVRVVSHRHDVQFLKRESCANQKRGHLEVGIHVYGRFVYLIFNLSYYLDADSPVRTVHCS